MTVKPISKLLAGTLLIGAAATANALSVSLVGPTAAVDVGETVSFDIMIDFTHEPILGGFVDVTFDSSVLSFDSFQAAAVLNDPDYIGDFDLVRPRDVFDGLLNGIFIGEDLDVNTVPISAALWLMFGALGTLFGFGRKQA